jgi:hypothetical protein
MCNVINFLLRARHLACFRCRGCHRTLPVVISFNYSLFRAGRYLASASVSASHPFYCGISLGELNVDDECPYMHPHTSAKRRPRCPRPFRQYNSSVIWNVSSTHIAIQVARLKRRNDQNQLWLGGSARSAAHGDPTTRPGTA